MTLSLGIRLVILLPTFLFFVGFFFKALVEKKAITELVGTICENLEMLHEMMLFFNGRYNDFSISLAIDSLFILIANGLIIIFELSNNEIGILSIIFGVIFSIYMLLCIYTKINAIIGRLGVFGLLGGEFFYFLLYGVEFPFIQYNHFMLINSLIGMGFGIGLSYLIFDKTYAKSSEALVKLIWISTKKRCEEDE